MKKFSNPKALSLLRWPSSVLPSWVSAGLPAGIAQKISSRKNPRPAARPAIGRMAAHRQTVRAAPEPMRPASPPVLKRSTPR